MTKEELEKEAQENCVCTDTYMRANYITGYLAGAEPREKQIAELEKRCANYEMKISKMEKGTCDVCKETEKDKKIAELEQENAQLKEANKTLATMNNNMWVELEMKRAESQGIANKLHQLIKAKDLLAKWVELFKPKSDTALPTPIQIDTEQFLNEVEKC